MAWQISIASLNGGAFNYLPALNIVQPKRHLKSQDVSEFTFTESCAQMDGTPLGAMDDLCIVQWVQDELTDPPTQIVFQGKLTKLPRVGAATKEERQYVISDPWKDLERLPYQQEWAVNSGGYAWRSEVILGSDTGALMTNDQVIGAVLTFAKTLCGANLQIGNILGNAGGSPDNSTGAPAPYKEMQDIGCAEALKELLRLTPDAVTWFDYTQSPPALNMTRRGNCAALNFNGFDGTNEVQIELTPRNDLVRSMVLLRYVQESQVDGVASETITPDSAGLPGYDANGLQPDAFVANVRIAGSNEAFQKQPVTATVFPYANSSGAEGGPDDDPTILWWQGKVPFLSDLYAPGTFDDGDIANQLVITNVYSTYQKGQGDDDGSGNIEVDYTQYPNELIDGAMADWMGVRWARCYVTALVKYSFPADPADYTAQDNQATVVFGGDDGSGCSAPMLIYAKPTLTNAVTKTYEGLSSYTAAEPLPIGLAAILYASLSVLHYEGSYTSAGGEIVPGNTLGNVLNLTGGQNTAWATMNALVQQIEEDLDPGVVKWHVGPPGHLGVQDLLEMLRYTRTRKPSSHASEKKSGAPTAPTVEGGVAVRGDSAGNKPPPSGYPWVGYGRDNNDPDADPIWEAVLGIGQSSFANALADAMRGDPLSALELSVGNDGSDWADDDAAYLGNLGSVLSLVSGSAVGGGDYEDDQFWLGAISSDETEGGSFAVYPGDPSILLAGNGTLDPSTIGDDDTIPYLQLDLSDMLMKMFDGAGSFCDFDLSDAPQLNLSESGGSLVQAQADDGNTYLNLNDQSGSYIDLHASDAVATIYNESTGAEVDIDTADLDGETASFNDWTGDDDYVLSTMDQDGFESAVNNLIESYLADCEVTASGSCDDSGDVSLTGTISHD